MTIYGEYTLISIFLPIYFNRKYIIDLLMLSDKIQFVASSNISCKRGKNIVNWYFSHLIYQVIMNIRLKCIVFFILQQNLKMEYSKN